MGRDHAPEGPGRSLRLDHVALWVSDLEAMRDFYVTVLGGAAGPLYENAARGFRSYFVAFGDGGCIELMAQGPRTPSAPAVPATGYAHVALSVGGNGAVDAMVGRLRARGVRIAGEPRTTGDGYYEAVVEDPEGNLIELTA